MALGSTQSLVKMCSRNFPGGKGCRCVRLTTSPPSYAECHKIWEPKPPGTLWVTPGLLRDSILNLSTRCRWAANFISLPFYPQDRTMIPRDDGGFWVQENLFSFPGIETGFLGRPIRSLLTMPTTLSQLFTHLKYATHVGVNLLFVGINLDGHIHQQMHTICLQSVRKFWITSTDFGTEAPSSGILGIETYTSYLKLMNSPNPIMYTYWWMG
jgi:hypothetical protein